MNKCNLKYILMLTLFSSSTSVYAAYNLDMKPVPNPPAAGENILEIRVKDMSGKPVDGAALKIEIFMPAMGTMPRMEEKGEVKAKGKGLYEVSYDLSMGGSWEITVTVEKDGKTEVSHHSITTGIPDVTHKGANKAAPKQGEQQAAQVMDVGPERLQKIGVRFAETKTMPVKKMTEAVGVIEQDQTHREELVLRFSGYIVRQFKGRLGDSVNAGEPLFSVYSPDLVAAQSEFILANDLGPSLQEAARQKLRNLGLSDREIDQIQQEGKPRRDVTIRSSSAGTILEINVREGAAVGAGQVAYVIGDLSKSYIVASVFQQDIGSLRVGQVAKVKIPGFGNESVQGRIDLIYPQVEERGGTAKVRVEMEGYLPGMRPGGYADISFPVELGNLLVIPTEAVLYSGKHRYVFVDQGGGVLEPREVALGRTADGMVEVIEGLAEGDRVAASGTFLISSEAQLRSALPKWRSIPAGVEK
jgi:Cu(I)/Ag(I) efflux system membrane fusion protein